MFSNDRRTPSQSRGRQIVRARSNHTRSHSAHCACPRSHRHPSLRTTGGAAGLLKRPLHNHYTPRPLVDTRSIHHSVHTHTEYSPPYAHYSHHTKHHHSVHTRACRRSCRASAPQPRRTHRCRPGAPPSHSPPCAVGWRGAISDGLRIILEPWRCAMCDGLRITLEPW